MPPKRAQPPKESKAELMEKTVTRLQEKYGVNTEGAVLYLLAYFTSADLVEILRELKDG